MSRHCEYFAGEHYFEHRGQSRISLVNNVQQRTGFPVEPQGGTNLGRKRFFTKHRRPRSRASIVPRLKSERIRIAGESLEWSRRSRRREVANLAFTRRGRETGRDTRPTRTAEFQRARVRSGLATVKVINLQHVTPRPRRFERPRDARRVSRVDDGTSARPSRTRRSETRSAGSVARGAS